MTFDRDKEISDNLALVTYIIEKYWPKFDEDLFQTGCMGLIKAVDSYDPNRGVKKSTYYGKCVLNEIYMSNRKYATVKHGRDAKIMSLNEIVTEDRNERLDYIEANVDVEEEVEKNDEIKRMIEVYDKLEPIEQTIVKHTFGLFESEILNQHQIAKLINGSQPNVSKSLKKILRKMKGLMENEK